MYLNNNASVNDIINWTNSVAPAVAPTVPTIIAPIPHGYEKWSDGIVVLAPITRGSDGKIIWTDVLIDWVNEINGPGYALHPKEDLIVID